tara:strand:+ start:145 stop:726 length:582 start_codon:yes stop_codon:yes gene_type:complete
LLQLLFFSNNFSKIKELKIFFKNSKLEIYSPSDYGINKEPKENGKSFAENAKIKSSYGYNKIKIPCFADDSGICIEALNWKPAIYSKRFIDKFNNSYDCFNYIINKTLETGKRGAYFQTSISFTFKHDYHIIFEGKVYGHISTKILGKNGFGYDPIFIPNGYNKTFAQMNNKNKNLISHRSIAANKLQNFLFN